MGWGVPEFNADATAENERKSHRADERFLLGEGMKAATGRSLAEDNKSLYDELLSMEKDLRHQVAHRGMRPPLPEAKACFRACCEGVRWLCDIAGFRVKEMNPVAESFTRGLSAGSSKSHVCSETEMETIRRMFGVILTTAEKRDKTG